MTVHPVESPPDLTLRSRRTVAVTRAGAAVLWAVALVAALHGRRVLTGSDVPLSAGLLLAAYPVIDLAALSWERRRPADTRQQVAFAVDGLAVAALLVATLTLHTGAVLVAFGTWAVVSGLLQLGQAWQGQGSRRVQLPLIVSGAISTIAGVSFAAMAAQHAAHLANIAGYAVLGAVFFVVWALLGRARTSRADERSDAELRSPTG